VHYCLDVKGSTRLAKNHSKKERNPCTSILNRSQFCLRVEIAPHLKELKAITDAVEDLAAIATKQASLK